jgi:hypothetical protein
MRPLRLGVMSVVKILTEGCPARIAIGPGSTPALSAEQPETAGTVRDR